MQKINPNAQVDFYPGVTGGTTAAQLTTVDAASVAAAKNYNAVVVVIGTDSSTGSEVETMGDVDTSSFQSTTPALLWSSYNGQRQGAALADVLLGKVDPSGHLPFTWYANQEQLPPITDYTLQPTATTDGRTYMYFTGSVTWPFGYGLSYTDFGYSHLRVSRGRVNANGSVTVSADVTNTGSAAGATVAQLYAATPGAPASLQLPDKRLESFKKVELAPGQTKGVTFTVNVPDLAFFSDAANKYVAYDGRYALQLGGSSSDIGQQALITVQGALDPKPSVVTVQPVMPGDAAQGVVQRVFFPADATIAPEITVSLSDQSLVGYVTLGQSTPLREGMTVRYSTDHPDVVRVSRGGTVLTAVGPGPATITATVRYHGATATGSVVVDVQ